MPWAKHAKNIVSLSLKKWQQIPKLFPDQKMSTCTQTHTLQFTVEQMDEYFADCILKVLYKLYLPLENTIQKTHNFHPSTAVISNQISIQQFFYGKTCVVSVVSMNLHAVLDIPLEDHKIHPRNRYKIVGRGMDQFLLGLATKQTNKHQKNCRDTTTHPFSHTFLDRLFFGLFV